jgi:hypothetical protein
MATSDNLQKVSLVFQQPLFAREELLQNFPTTLGPPILSVSELEAAFTAAQEKLSRSSVPTLDNVDEAVATEALNFYNYVVADGRYLVETRENPHQIAARLGYHVSSKALALISDADLFKAASPIRPHNTVVLVVIAVCVITVHARATISEIVIDHSGHVKI